MTPIEKILRFVYVLMAGLAIGCCLVAFKLVVLDDDLARTPWPFAAFLSGFCVILLVKEVVQ